MADDNNDDDNNGDDSITNVNIDAEQKITESLLETVSDANVSSRVSFEEFTDERVSHQPRCLWQKTDED